jgi:hypothetical protein
LRGEESGGGTVAIGHYVGFAGVGTDGLTLSFLNQTLQPNSGHRLVFANNLARFELFRYGNNHCHLLVSLHSVGRSNGEASEGNRPAHIRRNLILEHWGHIQKTGSLLFLDRAGEEVEIPEYLKPYINQALVGTRCAPCVHSHFEKLPSLQLPVPLLQLVTVPEPGKVRPEQMPKHKKKKEPHSLPSNVLQEPSMEAVP